MSALDSLRYLGSQLSVGTRKAIYKGTKIVAALATVALFLLPLLPDYGVTVELPSWVFAILTGLVTLGAQVADANVVDTAAEVDLN